MAVSQERITVHSLPDLKNTSDDAVPTYLNSLKFKQSHTLSDIRLILGYTAFAICAATFYWDYRLGFEPTKLYTTIAVVVYSLINGFLTFWIWGVEKGAIYIGTSPTGESIKINSSTTKHVPKYKLVVTTTGKDGKTKNQKLEKSFTEWFDKDGHFVTKPFQQMFASNVEVIGKVDPSNVIKKEKKVPVDDGKSMSEKWASLLAESSGDVPLAAETTPTPSKGTKKRAKKA